MAYSEHDAAAALDSVKSVQRRTSILLGYERGAPYFFLWGIIWIVGYTASEFYRQHAGLIWLLLNLIGISAGLCIQKAGQSVSSSCHNTYQYIGASVSAFVFVAATYFIFRPSHGEQLDAFPPLLVAFIYMLAGLWRGLRFTVVGVLVTTLTVCGYAFLPQHFALWMAVVGGVTLLTTGFWLRHG